MGCRGHRAVSEMKRHYREILERFESSASSCVPSSPPIWFDENGVPRWVPFSPSEIADIYARVCALMEIRCQNCERSFLVSMVLPLSEAGGRVLDEMFEYGDPPNVECCPSGPTMNSVPIRVVEFWVRTPPQKVVGSGWVRVESEEKAIRCEWWQNGWWKNPV